MTVIIIVFMIFMASKMFDVAYNYSANINIITLVLSTLFVLTVIFDAIYQYFYFKSYHYASDSNNIQIRKGVISKKEINLPYDRITDLYVEQDMLDRIFRLYDLHFSTATATSAMEAHIDGLNKLDCENLKNMIMKKMNNIK